MIVWLKTTGFTTVKADAQTQADTWSDSRAEHYWATNTDEFPDAFGTFSWMSCNYPWDISMLFDSGGMWSGTEPISPDHCTAKISGCCNSYNINNMKAAVEGLNACTVVLGTADEKLGEPLIRIVPNPSTGLFTIDLAEKIQDNIEVSVINIIGQKSTAPINIVSDQSLELDLSDYPNGTYFISVKGRSHSLTYKVMKHQGSN
ncbi:MAG: T9SS type A sorting domain-containing protein [Flavobacteriales bacterium]|nr:T9SS type A sorting domain-containing protein [Flavobacteriales bacterium]